MIIRKINVLFIIRVDIIFFIINLLFDIFFFTTDFFYLPF